MQRPFAFAAVIGTAGWLGASPGWESAVALVGAIAALVYADRDRDIQIRAGIAALPDAPPDDHVRHDRDLFARYEAILSERQLREELDGPLYNGTTTADFGNRLDRWCDLAQSAEGRFLLGGVQVMADRLLRDLRELKLFIARHFFTQRGATIADGLFLRPDQKHADAQVYWDAHAELQRLLNDTAASVRAFRNVVKSRLAV